MCVVIDTCCLATVFDVENSRHYEFEHIRRWIIQGNGSLIYGGRKYKRELKRARKYFRIIAELSRKGRVIQVDDRKVDRIAQKIRNAVVDADFNDEHLVAIVVVARCRVVCTDDKAAQSYLTRSDLYPRGVRKPKIYSRARNKDLCSQKHVVGVCKNVH